MLGILAQAPLSMAYGILTVESKRITCGKTYKKATVVRTVKLRSRASTCRGSFLACMGSDGMREYHQRLLGGDSKCTVTPETDDFLNKMHESSKVPGVNDREGNEYVQALRSSINWYYEVVGRPVTQSTVDEGLLNATGVRALWVRWPSATEDSVVLHFHGGGYVSGKPDAVQAYLERLSRQCRCGVLSVDYRLAPEHTVSDAVEDMCQAYRWVRRTVDAKRIAFTGESAGGGLLFLVMQRLQSEGEVLPACAVPVSPWMDLNPYRECYIRLSAVDRSLSWNGVRQCALVASGGLPFSSACISPLYGSFVGLPPTLMIVSDTELVIDECLEAVEKARSHGVSVDVRCVSGVPHVWNLYTIPEGYEETARIADWIRRRISTVGKE